MSNSPGDVTQLLQAMRHGDQQAAEQLIPLVYSELHRLARSYLRGERGDHTLQPTALINEAYMRMVKSPIDWQNRSHFVAIAARAMRHILVDHARAHLAAARGGEFRKVEWDEALGIPADRAAELIDLDEALDRLEKINPRQARVVELRYIGGLSFEEVAASMELSSRTVKRDWSLARIWLFKELRPSQPT